MNGHGQGALGETIAGESGRILALVLGFFVSYIVVFAATFYFLNGRSFRIQSPAPLGADSTGAQVDSTALLAARIDSLLRLVDSTRAVLDSLTGEVGRRQKELKELEEKLAAAGAQERQEELRRARKLAAILAALPDSAVGPTVAKLDDELLVMVLQKSTEKNAARVLAALGPHRAAELSERLVRLN